MPGLVGQLSSTKARKLTLTLGGIGGGLGGGSTSIDEEAFSAALTRIKTIKSDKIMFSCVLSAFL